MKHKGKHITDSTQWNACRLVLVDFATAALQLQYVNINSTVKCKTGKNKLIKYIVLYFGEQLCMYVCDVSKTFGEWYQKTNKTEDTNKLT
jgi:hypothetical protein